jgi:hypothetical protein
MACTDAAPSCEYAKVPVCNTCNTFSNVGRTLLRDRVFVNLRRIQNLSHVVLLLKKCYSVTNASLPLENFVTPWVLHGVTRVLQMALLRLKIVVLVDFVRFMCPVCVLDMLAS